MTVDRGWITPNGKWYRGNSDEHDKTIISNGMKVETVEKYGWCRVYGQDKFVPFICERRLTAEQRNTLAQHGFVIKDSD